MSRSTEGSESPTTKLNRWSYATSETRAAVRWVSTTLSAVFSATGAFVFTKLLGAPLGNLTTAQEASVIALGVLGASGLALSIFAMLRVLAPVPNSVSTLSARDKNRWNSAITDILPPDVSSIDQLSAELQAHARAAAQLSVLALDSKSDQERSTLELESRTEEENYRRLAERRDRTLDRIEQLTTTRRLNQGFWLLLVSICIMLTSAVSGAIVIQHAQEASYPYLLIPQNGLEGTSLWRSLGLGTCATGSNEALPVMSASSELPRVGDKVSNVPTQVNCDAVTFSVPANVTVTRGRRS